MSCLVHTGFKHCLNVDVLQLHTGPEHTLDRELGPKLLLLLMIHLLFIICPPQSVWVKSFYSTSNQVQRQFNIALILLCVCV